ncbi:MAG: lysophospholipid acyltransferase family protein [Coriobacteriia bacterium]
MGLEALSNSRTGMRIALAIGRAVPRRAALSVVDFAARRVAANRDSETWRAARANQYVLSGCTLSGAALDEAAWRNVRSMARSLYDLYHALGRPSREWALLARDEVFDTFIERHRTEGPFVYVGIHLGNFDLAGRLLAHEGWRPQVLSVPNPHGGYEWQNEVRAQAGLEMTPVSLESLKHAARRLESGGSVFTGIDWPMPQPDKVQPRFFGHDAPLPLLHVRLAMRSRVPVIALAAPRMPDGRYRLVASDPIVMEGEKAVPEVLCANAERCLAPAERWISEYREQWAMPHVVWPDVVVPDNEV